MEAPSVRRVTEIVSQFYKRFYTQSVLYQKSYQESVRYAFAALCA